MICSNDSCDVIEMIAGSRRTFSFNIFGGDDPRFRMSSYKARFALVYAPNRSMIPVLVRDMTVETDSSGKATGFVYVTLETKDTYLLNGKYIYQIIIYNPGTKQADVPHQGEILIYENVDKDFLAQLRDGE